MRTLLLACLCVPAFAEDPRVKPAIERGVKAILENKPAEIAEHGIGPPCLAGLALLEADLKPEHPTVQAIRQLVRANAPKETQTYQVSLAILFLDRLGNPADVACIQMLGARLLTGQHPRGGWGYNTADNITPQDEARIAAAMNGPGSKEKFSPEAARIAIATLRGARATVAQTNDDNNSTTQFAIIALWVARRSGLPTDMAFRRLQARFLQTQNPANGGWGYGDVAGTSTPSMTCCGLLGLAAAKASGESQVATSRIDAEGKPSEEVDPFLRPPSNKAKAETEDDAAVPPLPPVDPVAMQSRDKAIERGLLGLGQLLNTPPALGAATSHGGLDDLYFFWLLERVAVAYGLDTVGSVDWYNWGLKAVLDNQQGNGAWLNHYSSPNSTTAFAILFLKRANLTGDLTRKLTGKVKDPGSGELRGGRGAAISKVGNVNVQDVKPNPATPNAPAINIVRVPTEADKLAEAMVAANDRDWSTKLKAAKEAKGPQHTAALVHVIASVEGRRQYQAREALAERLTRMNSETLQRMLRESDAEVRRAACLAVAMKDDKTALPGVIECITDPNDVVVRAAKASLKAVSNEDHGPASGASDDEKRKAAEAWRYWYETDKLRNMK